MVLWIRPRSGSSTGLDPFSGPSNGATGQYQGPRRAENVPLLRVADAKPRFANLANAVECSPALENATQRKWVTKSGGLARTRYRIVGKMVDLLIDSDFELVVCSLQELSRGGVPAVSIREIQERQPAGPPSPARDGLNRQSTEERGCVCVRRALQRLTLCASLSPAPVKATNWLTMLFCWVVNTMLDWIGGVSRGRVERAREVGGWRASMGCDDTQDGWRLLRLSPDCPSSRLRSCLRWLAVETGVPRTGGGAGDFKCGGDGGRFFYSRKRYVRQRHPRNGRASLPRAAAHCSKGDPRPACLPDQSIKRGKRMLGLCPVKLRKVGETHEGKRTSCHGGVDDQDYLPR